MIVPDVHIIDKFGYNYKYHHAKGLKLRRKYFKKKMTLSSHFVLTFKNATFPTFIKETFKKVIFSLQYFAVFFLREKKNQDFFIHSW